MFVILSVGHEPMFEGKKVMLLEAGPKQTFEDPLPEKFYNRTCAISAGSVSLLSSEQLLQYHQQ